MLPYAEIREASNINLHKNILSDEDFRKFFLFTIILDGCIMGETTQEIFLHVDSFRKEGIYGTNFPKAVRDRGCGPGRPE